MRSRFSKRHQGKWRGTQCDEIGTSYKYCKAALGDLLLVAMAVCGTRVQHGESSHGDK
jgi:hypothetical protein